MDENTKIKAEAAAFRGLVKHLQERKDVQNIDLMNLAGFCRNCLSKWYMASANELGASMDYDEATAEIYGMSYADWKKNHQTKASDDQINTFEETKPLHAKISGHN